MPTTLVQTMLPLMLLVKMISPNFMILGEALMSQMSHNLIWNISLVAKIERFLKTRRDSTKDQEELVAVSKNKSEKGLVAESFEESLSLEDEGITKVKAFMAIVKDEPVVGKSDARSGKRKETISSKDVVFTKGENSPSETSPNVTSYISDKTEQATEKESTVKYVKKKAQTKTPLIPDSSPEKKADSSTRQLLLTLMKEVKGLKE
ncbi:hypothetical protein Tco_1043998 [Tanacetum coccineum]|uniref:Uncharacterized protein n=1 Tax=Tanacetum coccineum TaxID=301880 RepID=A0ABQ5GR91_9ASTR